MNHRYSLAQLMALPFTPAQMLRLAQDAGCTAAGIRLLPNASGGFFHPLLHDANLRRETLAALHDTGVQVLDVEVVRIDAEFAVSALTPLLDLSAQLQARHLLVTCDDADEARFSAHFAALCDAAAPYGLSADLEPIPWTPVATVNTAKRIVAAVAKPNAGLLIDALHFARADNRLQDLDDIPASWLHYAQICDGLVPGPSSHEALKFDARCERLLPGEGGIDLQALFARLPADITISIEVPSDSRAPVLGYPEWARRAKAATLHVLGPAA